MVNPFNTSFSMNYQWLLSKPNTTTAINILNNYTDNAGQDIVTYGAWGTLKPDNVGTGPCTATVTISGNIKMTNNTSMDSNYLAAGCGSGPP